MSIILMKTIPRTLFLFITSKNGNMIKIKKIFLLKILKQRKKIIKRKTNFYQEDKENCRIQEKS